MRRVLIVDDEYLVRVGIRSFLDWEEHGYTIVGEAANGQKALEKIEECKPDVVLTDLKMDIMDGFELIQICRQRWPDILFVVLSSYDDGPNVKRAMKLGASDYIFKLTSKPEELLKILDELPYGNNTGKMETVVRKNLSGIKEQLIRKAAQSYCPDRASLQKDFAQLGLTTDFSKPFYILLINFSNGDDSNSMPALTKYALENMAQELITEHLAGEVYPYVGNSMLAILPESSGTDNFIEQTESTFTHLAEYAKRYLGIELRGMVSNLVQNMDLLPNAVAECRCSLQHQLVSPGKLQAVGKGHRPEINEICQRIEKDISQEYTVGTAAEICHMSESHFAHLFKKETGLSFVEYVNQKKIQRAEYLLTHTSLRIGEIAMQIGLDNQNYFSSMFRKYKGKSPVEYRAASQKAEM